VNVEVDDHEFGRIMSALAGSSVIFALHQEGADDEPIALLREMQTNPVTDEILHIDLFEIPRGVPINVDVILDITGESAAISRGDATLAKVIDSVEISCLPRELPESIPVSIEGLEVNDKVYVKDLETPAGEIVTDGDAMVLSLKTPVVFIEEEEEEEGIEGEAAEEGAEGEEGAKATEEPGTEGDDKKAE